MKSENERPTFLEVGRDLYIPIGTYGEFRAEETCLITGGAAKIRSVTTTGTKQPDHVIYFEEVDRMFLWSQLAPHQEKWRHLYGDVRATVVPRQQPRPVLGKLQARLANA